MSMVVDLHKKNGERPEFDVYIGRRVRWHEEFTSDSDWANTKSSLEYYEEWVRIYMWDRLPELRGKVLGCWCVTTDKHFPLVCHGQILMRLVKERSNE